MRKPNIRPLLRAFGAATLIAAGVAILGAVLTQNVLLVDTLEHVLAFARAAAAGEVVPAPLRNPLLNYGIILVSLGVLLALGPAVWRAMWQAARMLLGTVLAPILVACWGCGGLMLRKQAVMMLDNPAETEWMGAQVAMHTSCMHRKHARSEELMNPKKPVPPAKGTPAPRAEERRRIEAEVVRLFEACQLAHERVADLSAQVQACVRLGRGDEAHAARDRLDVASRELHHTLDELKRAVRRRDHLDQMPF